MKVLLEFNFSDPESGPVLDSNLPNSIAEYVSQKDSVSITNVFKVKIIAHTRPETIAHYLAREGESLSLSRRCFLQMSIQE